jgi:anti-anti-sigma factor
MLTRWIRLSSAEAPSAANGSPMAAPTREVGRRSDGPTEASPCSDYLEAVYDWVATPPHDCGCDFDLIEGPPMDQETSPERYFRVESHDGVTILHFEDIQIGPDARGPLYGVVEDQGHTRVILDLSDVWGLSSLALGILASFQQKVEARGGRLILCGLNPNNLQLFRMTKLDQIFVIHEDRAAALRAVATG